jgi:hypothetical protein
VTTPIHGSTAAFYFNGKVLTTYLKNAQWVNQRDTADTTTLGMVHKSFIPGLKDSTLSATGLLFTDATAATTALGVEAALNAALTTSGSNGGFVTYLPSGDAIGNPGHSMYVESTGLDVNADISSAISVAAKFTGSGAVMKGAVVANGSPTSPSASVDGGLTAATSNATATIQVFTVTTSPIAFQIQDSADNTTFADLATYTASATVAGSYLIEVPTGVRRYVRLRWTGAGSFTAVLARGR